MVSFENRSRNNVTTAGATEPCRDETKTYFTRIWNRKPRNNERNAAVCIMWQIKRNFWFC